MWGRVADRTGNRGVLAIGTFLARLLLPSTGILAGVAGFVGGALSGPLLVFLRSMRTGWKGMGFHWR